VPDAAAVPGIPITGPGYRSDGLIVRICAVTPIGKRSSIGKEMVWRWSLLGWPGPAVTIEGGRSLSP
jgi:hypothetical protein